MIAQSYSNIIGHVWLVGMDTKMLLNGLIYKNRVHSCRLFFQGLFIGTETLTGSSSHLVIFFHFASVSAPFSVSPVVSVVICISNGTSLDKLDE